MTLIFFTVHICFICVYLCSMNASKQMIAKL